MANETVLMMTPDGKKYNVPQDQVTTMQSQFKARAIDDNPGIVKRFTTSAAMIPENIDTSMSGMKRSLPQLGQLGTWIDALKQSISALNPISGMAEARSAAKDRFEQPGIMGKVAGATEYGLSTIPYFGPATDIAMEKSGHGDIAGGLGGAIPAALMGAGLAHGAPALAERPWVQNPIIGGVSWFRGLGANAEDMARKAYIKGEGAKALEKYNQDVSSTNEKYSKMVDAAGNKNAETKAAHQLELQQHANEYMDQLSKLREHGIDKSIAESEASVKDKTLNKQSGPVYQRLTGMAQQVYDNTKDLFRSVQARNNANWAAWRNAMGEGAEAAIAPVQQAIVDAERDIIHGSPENISIFRNILKEGQQKGGSFIDGEEGELKPAVSDAKIPLSDIQGYMTELGRKLYSGADLPGDVYRALKTVRNAADGVLTDASEAKGLGKIYSRLKGDYSVYADNFLDHNGPMYKLLHADSPLDKLKTITGDTGRELTDAIGHYAKDFNLVKNAQGVSPIDLVEKTRSLQHQVKNLSSRVPGEMEPPTLNGGASSIPYEPTPEKPNIPPPNVKGFNPREWRLQEMTRQALENVHPSRFESSAWGSATAPFRRLLAEAFNNPTARKWMSEYTHPGPKFQPFSGPIPPAPKEGGASPEGSKTPVESGPLPVPPMNPLERADLERQAGYKFNSDLQAYAYKMRKVHADAVNQMLEEFKIRAQQ